MIEVTSIILSKFVENVFYYTDSMCKNELFEKPQKLLEHNL